MSRRLRLRVSLVVFSLVVSVALGLVPSLAAARGFTAPAWLIGRAIKLGLDLRGGVDFLIAVETDVAVRRESATGVARLGRELTATEIATVRDDAVTQALRTVERRVNALGVSEPSLSRVQGRDALQIQLPGVSEVARAKALLGTAGVLELLIVDAGPAASADALNGSGQPANSFVVAAHTERGAGGAEAYYRLRTPATVTGADIRTARTTMDQNGRPAIAFTLSPDGAERFAALTGAHVGRLLAVVLDGTIASVARIDDRIGREGLIAGQFSSAEAADLATVLRSGALTAPLRFLSEHTVSATLGADAIRAGVTASLAALVVVAVFMVWYYKRAGVNAVLSMIANLLVLLAILGGIGSVLTLPGIAGFVLTIGMGVDSNVLIFERIKEELEAGQPVRVALDAGYRRVFRTLLDTHVAAFISAAFLFQFGSSAVQGFAVTLAAGLAANLYTSTFVSRTLMEVTIRRRGDRPLSI